MLYLSWGDQRSLAHLSQRAQVPLMVLLELGEELGVSAFELVPILEEFTGTLTSYFVIDVSVSEETFPNPRLRAFVEQRLRAIHHARDVTDVDRAELAELRDVVLVALRNRKSPGKDQLRKTLEFMRRMTEVRASKKSPFTSWYQDPRLPASYVAYDPGDLKSGPIAYGFSREEAKDNAIANGAPTPIVQRVQPRAVQ